MSLAEETRDAARRSPFLIEALRAGVVNYAAAARALDVAGETDAVAAALRRFADDLPPRGADSRDARVRMERGLEPDEDDPLLSVGGNGFSSGDGALTGVIATGAVDAGALAHALGLLRANGIAPVAAGVAGDALLVVVGRRDGAAALRLVEGALGDVPTPP